MSKHTKGPWEVWKGHLDVYAGPCADNTPHGICGFRAEVANLSCGFDNGDMERDEAEANAHLIAAAPDLLAVVQELYDDLGSKNELTPQGRKLLDMATAALRKAEPHEWDEPEDAR